MIGPALEKLIDAVTTHNRVVIVVMLLLTAGMVAGVSNLDTTQQAEEDPDEFGDIEELDALEYVEERYADRETENVSYAAVYVSADDGNALSKAALLEALHYQQAVLESDELTDALATDGDVVGVANLVAIQLADDPAADLEAQLDALEAADDEAVAAAVSATLSPESEALQFVPASYEPGSETSPDHRLLFALETTDEEAYSDATAVLHEEAGERDDLEFFTVGEHAWAEGNQQLNENTTQLILPVALALILGVLAFTYRDPVDVVVGMTGVVVSICWMFGILGWLGVAAGMTMIIGPVLIGGISIDFGFHVFNRYREQRGPDDGIREPMKRGVRSVAVAFGLVTVTAAVGFLANLANPLTLIRQLGVGITLGVASAFVVFVTLVPALKVSADGLLERVGFNRRKRPLGHGPYLRRALGASVTLARYAAPVVVVVALVAGAGGAVAWTALDEESFQEQTDSAAEWKQNLPGPLAWDDPDIFEHDRYVQERYQTPDDDEAAHAQLLVRGDVTDDAALEAVDDGLETADETGFAFEQPGVNTAVSPLSVMDAVAETDEEFAATYEAADTTGDGVPDENLEAVYDELYATAPAEASQVIERTDGEYDSLRVIVPVDRSTTFDEQADGAREVAATVEAGNAELTATPVDMATINQAVLGEITQGILHTLVIAVSVIAVGLAAIYRVSRDSATLGLVTVVPIALVIGLVVGGMHLFEIPLTMLTALLMSLVVGLGIDYNIHISDRFAQELEAGRDALEALELAVTGTGGALLGSTLTSAGAFATLVLHPHPQLESFGAMVVLALLASFLLSVVVLPSMLYLWARHLGTTTPERSVAPAVASED
ncbi:efflux RND transporter permease subunit [Natronobeatus ordinarius]|uniref:efflux RND transporter permease subunit n=1 Tax=Natronobeatus ordinarius TaxID=2963433 RepID=UPI0020CEFEB9|nr:MMPL family transporter [Natronobeatus ordinarius]